jgi:hypothetical protein
MLSCQSHVILFIFQFYEVQDVSLSVVQSKYILVGRSCECIVFVIAVADNRQIVVFQFGDWVGGGGGQQTHPLPKKTNILKNFNTKKFI